MHRRVCLTGLSVNAFKARRDKLWHSCRELIEVVASFHMKNKRILAINYIVKWSDEAGNGIEAWARAREFSLRHNFLKLFLVLAICQ